MATVTSLGFSIFSTYSGRGVSAARRDINDLNSDLDKSKTKLGAAATGFFSLGTAASLLGPAIMPIGTALLGVGAASATMSIAAGTALGAYGFAMKSAITNTEKMAKKHKELTAVQQTFINSTKQMKSAMDGVSTGTMNLTLHTATLIVQGLTSVIRGMTPVIKAVAPVVDEVANAFKKWAAGDGLKRFVGIIIKEGVPALHNLFDAGRSVLGFLGDGFRALAPTIIPTSKAIANGAASLKKWGDNGGFANFLTSVRNQGPAVKQFFEALGQSTLQLGKAMAGLGPLALNLTTLLLRMIAAMPIPVLQALILSFSAWKLAMIGVAAANLLATVSTMALGTATIVTGGMVAAMSVTILLLVVAVAAVGVGIFLLVTHWNTAWNAIKQTAMTVWDFLTHGLGMLTLALLGPIGVLILLGTHWSQVWTAMKIVAEAVWNALRVGFGAFAAAMKLAMTFLGSAMQTTWNASWNAMRTAAIAVWNALRVAFGVFAAAFKTAMTILVNFLKSAWDTGWNAIKTAAVAVWNALRTAFGVFAAAFKTAMTILMTTLKATWNAGWNAIKTAAVAVWNALRSAFGVFASAMKTATNLLMSAMAAAWGNGARAIGAAWSAIKKLVRDPIQAVVSVVYNNGIVKLWNIVAGVFGAPKLSNFTLPGFATGGPIKGPGSGTSDSIVARVSAGEHVWTAAEVKAAGGHGNVMKMREGVMGHSYKAAAQGDGMGGFALGGIIPSPGDIIGAIGSLIKDVGGVAGAAFSIATGFGGDILSSLGKLAMGEIAGPINSLIQKAANVGKDTVRGLIPGSPWIETLIAGGPGGTASTGGSNPQDVPANAQGGLAKNGNGIIQKMADYVKQWITSHDIVVGSGNTAEAQKWADAQVGKPYSLGGNFGTTFDCSQFMSGITQIILGKKPSPLFTTFAFTGAKQGPATFEKDLKAPFMVGVTNAGVGHMAGTLNGKNYEATPPAVRSGPGARGAMDAMFPMHYGMKGSIGGGQGVIPSGQHLAIIDAALAAAGVPPPGTKAAWEAGMNTLITRESAWNSSAINNTDSNAAAGHPSQGLAQVIPSTFAAFHVAGTSGNILDPIANVAAAIRYIVATYGNITNVQQANASLPPKGYARGTDRARKGWHMIDEDGGEWINFKGGEKVLPHGRTPRTGEGAPPAIHVENHWHGNPTKEAVQYAEGGMAESLRQAVHAGVGGRNC